VTWPLRYYCLVDLDTLIEAPGSPAPTVTECRRPMPRGGIRPKAMVAVIKLAFEAAGWVTGRATGIAGPMPLRRVHHAAD